MIPIKITHELNEHNYLNVDALILQYISFFSSLHVYLKSPVKLYIKNNIYWTVLGLSCSTRGLSLQRTDWSCGTCAQRLWHNHSCSMASGTLVRQQEIETQVPCLAR